MFCFLFRRLHCRPTLLANAKNGPFHCSVISSPTASGGIATQLSMGAITEYEQKLHELQNCIKFWDG